MFITRTTKPESSHFPPPFLTFRAATFSDLRPWPPYFCHQGSLLLLDFSVLHGSLDIPLWKRSNGLRTLLSTSYNIRLPTPSASLGELLQFWLAPYSVCTLLLLCKYLFIAEAFSILWWYFLLEQLNVFPAVNNCLIILFCLVLFEPLSVFDQGSRMWVVWKKVCGRETLVK